MFDFLQERTVGLKTQLVFEGNELEIYLPVNYLTNEPALASIVGEYIESIGLFLFKADGKLHELSLPIKFMFGYSERKKWNGKLMPDLKAQDYDVFVLKKGDIFCEDINHRENIKDIMFFMNTLIEGGKLPDIIAYDNTLNILLQALAITNSGSMGVSSVTYELLLSELYRSKNNISTPYRIYANNNPGKNYDYKMIKLTKIPETTSNFLSLIGEDINHQIVSAIYNTRNNRKDKLSPAEKLLKL